jgi:membrane associated rhomboid family serine protease
MAVPLEVTQSWQAVRNGDGHFSDFTTFGTLLSCAFLHGGADHLLYNMIFLWIFAALAVELLGSIWMLAIFFLTAIAGSITHVMFNPLEPIPMVGASGAVMGFMGAYLGMSVRWKLPDPHIFPIARPIPPSNLVILALIGVGMDWTAIMNRSVSNVAYGAHLGGFITGLFLTSFIAPKPKSAGVH